ncbi:MAG: FimB/Mfa2 family fimbrial subunit, partial [Prevotella sp.]|nr:FimB/Mfa2 family fimbrial subunit [Prevotella sp.]
MKKAIISVALLAAGLLSGCSSEESVSRPETIGQTGTLTFSFPAPGRSVTYAGATADENSPVDAVGAEAAINDVTIYMFEDSDGVLKARKSASWTEAGDRSVIFDVNDFTSNNANYTFYAVANVSGNITDNFVVGQTTIDDFTSAVATNTGTDPVSGSNMLMVGYTTIESLSPSTLPSQTIVLRHRVARFDINNLTSDGNPDNDNQESGSETFFE